MTLEAVDKLWKRSAQYHPDFALSYPLPAQKREVNLNQLNIIAVNMGTIYAVDTSQINWDEQKRQINLIAGVLFQYWKENNESVYYWLFDTNYPTDRPGSMSLRDQMLAMGIAANNILYEDRLMTTREIILQLQSAKFAITTRLHAGLLAARVRTPIIAFAYQNKVRDVLTDLGLSNCVLELSSTPETVSKMFTAVDNTPNAFRLSPEQLRRFDEQNRHVIREILCRLNVIFPCTS
jgi:polysaccharide pyruvyl transferase WcaK-like protein